MKSLFHDPILYTLQLGEHEIQLNELLGKEIQLQFLNQINCIRCGRVTTKSYAQGFCFPCFQVAPETEACVLRPELCTAHEGVARDMDFARNHCLIPHYVYLAYTSGIKVGVTRNTQIPTRWIDQGATRAIKLAKTPNRYLAGCIEVALKNFYADKTNWRQMLSKPVDGPDLIAVKEEALHQLPQEFRKYSVPDADPMELHYPLGDIPEKMNAVSLEKEPGIQDILVGIKGQYLIFKGGQVINVRKHNGYRVEIKFYS